MRVVVRQRVAVILTPLTAQTVALTARVLIAVSGIVAVRLRVAIVVTRLMRREWCRQEASGTGRVVMCVRWRRVCVRNVHGWVIEDATVHRTGGAVLAVVLRAVRRVYRDRMVISVITTGHREFDGH